MQQFFAMRCPGCGKEFEQRGYRFCPYDATRLDNPSGMSTTPPTESVAEGVVLGGRYTIRRYLAKGAMARLYIADDGNTGQLVAVKMMDQRLTKGPELRRRFLREAEAVSQVDHENVLDILEVGTQEDGTPYLVMELLQGETLGERLQVDKTLERSVALPILIGVCEALWAVHQQGIVHRDIKPDNLFLVGDPGKATGVRVFDFGLSRLFQSNLTTAGTIIGTPDYMAPEQVIAEQVDQRTDVYALGMIMYRIFTGQLPFSGGQGLETLAKQLLRPPLLPSRVAKDLDPRVERVIIHAIHKQPQNRYPSMKLFADDLRKLDRPKAQLLAGEPERDRYEISEVAELIAKTYRAALR
jgi:serine/threonine protein kinase